MGPVGGPVLGALQEPDGGVGGGAGVAAVDIRRGSFACREKSENPRPGDLLLAVLASSKTIRLLPGLASCARADSCQCRGSTATAPMPQSRGYQNCTRRPLGLEVAREARQPETLVPSKGDDHFTWKPRHKLRYISALFDRCGRHSARTTFKPYSCPRSLASPNRQGSLEARFSSSPHAVRDRRLKESLSL